MDFKENIFKEIKNDGERPQPKQKIIKKVRFDIPFAQEVERKDFNILQNAIERNQSNNTLNLRSANSTSGNQHQRSFIPRLRLVLPPRVENNDQSIQSKQKVLTGLNGKTWTQEPIDINQPRRLRSSGEF